MYHFLLTRRYLTTKILPFLSSLAVLLSTATVIIVWSIMGGFLNVLLMSGRSLVGDVIVSWPTIGFGYYEEFIADLEKDPTIEAATPMIEVFGMISLPDRRLQGVRIKGIDPESYNRVTGFVDTLWWKPLTKPLPKDKAGRDIRLDPSYATLWAEAFRNGQSLSFDPGKGASKLPGMVLGTECSGFNIRRPEGYYDIAGGVNVRQPDGTTQVISGFWINKPMSINVLPLNASGSSIEVVSRPFTVVNEIKTGVYEIDRSTVLMDLKSLQKMVKLDASEKYEAANPSNPYAVEDTPDGPRFAEPKVVGVSPARATTVLIRGKDNVPLAKLRERAREIYAEFAKRHSLEVPTADSIRVSTWEEEQGTLVAAVKKEIVMMLMILGVISLTVSFLILAIFWAIVREKTRDIGILRAIGASRSSVSRLWLGYAFITGAIGAVLGGGAAYLIVWNINPIHDWMGRTLNLVIWDPRIYYFSEIPNHVDPVRATLVMIAGVCFAVLGALIPAVRAAYMDPVRSLRFE